MNFSLIFIILIYLDNEIIRIKNVTISSYCWNIPKNCGPFRLRNQLLSSCGGGYHEKWEAWGGGDGGFAFDSNGSRRPIQLWEGVRLGGHFSGSRPERGPRPDMESGGLRFSKTLTRYEPVLVHRANAAFFVSFVFVSFPLGSEIIGHKLAKIYNLKHKKIYRKLVAWGFEPWHWGIYLHQN